MRVHYAKHCKTYRQRHLDMQISDQDPLLDNVIKGTVSQDFCFCFFRESSSPKPLIIEAGSFQIWSKTGINNTGGKFATNTASVVDTGGKQWEHYQTADT